MILASIIGVGVSSAVIGTGGALTVGGYNVWHRRRRVDERAAQLSRIAELEKATGIGRSDLDVIAEIDQKLGPPLDYSAFSRYAEPGKAHAFSDNETAWRNAIYASTGRFPSEEEWQAWAQLRKDRRLLP